MLAAFVTVPALAAKTQGTFQNLDFELANPVPVQNPILPGEVTFASALPDWNGSINGTPVTTALFNNYTLGAPSIDVFGPGWSSVNPGVIDGDYTVFLQSIASGATGIASISQSGTIPTGAESLQLKAWSFQPTAQFSVSFDGNTLFPITLSTGQTASGQGYTLYGFNVSPYAGDSGQLQITSTVPSGNGISWVEFDDIAFSTTAVPEPGVITLLGIGGLAFAFRGWRRRPKS
jgi:hypothetical protein